MPIIFFASASAQDKVANLQNFDKQRWHWGYFFGLNHYDFKITPTSQGMVDNKLGVNSNPTVGFSVGLIGDFRLNDYFNFRIEPGLSYATREIIYDKKVLNNFYDSGYTGTKPDNDSIRVIQSTYVNIPLLLKFGGERRHNIKPYLIGGINLGIDLASHQNSTDDNTSGVDGFRMNTINLFWEGGAGIDWYLPYFKFTTEIRGSFGIADELVKDGTPPGTNHTPWTGTLDKLQTRAIFFVLKFE